MSSSNTPRTSSDSNGRGIRLRRPSAALIISSMALFTALGGGAYAASTIGSAAIKNNAVPERLDIKNGTIKTVDIGLAARNALKGQTGTAGPQGPAGQQGATGQQGPKGDQGIPGTAAAKGDKGDPGHSRALGRLPATPGAPGLSELERVTRAPPPTTRIRRSR